MLSVENAKERMFCPKCGEATAYDCTGEGDWICSSRYNPDNTHNPAGCQGFISPLRERDLQAKELIRLRLENEQLREALRVAIAGGLNSATA
jgi:hypothetical protein